MKRKEFIEIMQEVVSLDTDTHEANDALKKLSPDFGGLMLERHDSLILKLITHIMNDESEWISYWMFDLDKGKKWKKGTVVDKDGKDIKLKTLNDLYNILQSDY